MVASTGLLQPTGTLLSGAAGMNQEALTRGLASIDELVAPLGQARRNSDVRSQGMIRIIEVTIFLVRNRIINYVRYPPF